MPGRNPRRGSALTGLLRPADELRREVQSFGELVDYMRPSAGRRELVGIEYELGPIDAATGGAAPYAGDRGVRALLLGLGEALDLAVHREAPAHPGAEGEPIGLGPRDPDASDGAQFSIEPGAQIEYAGPPKEHLASAVMEAACTIGRMARVADGLGMSLLSLGMQPLSRCADITMVPKHRYDIMLPYFRTHARDADLAECMMKRTVSVQVNLDYLDEADMVEKVRVATLASPFIGAVFAASPVSAGRLNGYASRRLEVWRRTDSFRCGPLAFALRPDFGFEAYARYAMGVPMMFQRMADDTLAPAHGKPFCIDAPRREVRPTLFDWQLHLTGIFTDVRVKRHMEVRVADAPGPELMFAVPALFVGLLYDANARAAVLDLLADRIGPDDLDPLMKQVARHGLDARFGGRAVRDIAREIVRLADGGLRARELAGLERRGAAALLEPLLERVVDRGRSAMDDVIDAWEGDCARDPARLAERFSCAPGFEEAVTARLAGALEPAASGCD